MAERQALRRWLGPRGTGRPARPRAGDGQTNTPFFFPNREVLVSLYRDIVKTAGVEQHVLSHSTIAPAVVDPVMIEQLTEILLSKSPIHLKRLSSHPEGKALVTLIGLETGSVRMAKQVMPSKGVPFKIEDWQSVVINGLEVLNRNNWFPMLTLMVGNPGETDEDVMATLDLIYEMERRGLFGFLVPSVLRDDAGDVPRTEAPPTSPSPADRQLATA